MTAKRYLLRACQTDIAGVVGDPWWQHKGKTDNHKIPDFLVWKSE